MIMLCYKDKEVYELNFDKINKSEKDIEDLFCNWTWVIL